MKPPARNFLLSSLAALASVVSSSRAGTTSPGSAAPLAAAPPPFAAEPHATRDVGRLRRSLRACTAEGIFAELVNAFAGGALLTAWALHLGAGPLFTGLLVALPQIALLFHIPGAWTTALLGHRRACLWLVGASRQVGLVLVVLPFLPVSDQTRRSVLLVVAGFSATLAMLGNNAWVAWMAELVPGRIRGRYFGRRTGACVLGGAIAAGVAGVLLDAARARGLVGETLAGLQLLASLCGFHTVRLLRRQHDPAPENHGSIIRLADALAPFRDPRARGLLIYHLAWNGAVGLAGSFFSLYMIRDLKMSFALIAVHGAAIALVRMLVAPLWGLLIDRMGARPVLAACSFSIATIPFLWLLPTESRLWPLAIDALMAGVFWTGHALAAFALPLAVTSRKERPFYLAGFSAVNGLAFAAATAVGGALASWLPATVSLGWGMTLASLQVLFVLSGLTRFAAAFLCLRVHEPAARSVNAVWSAILSPVLRRAVPRVDRVS
ncbi:MAG TPA: MFS transporter [Polyangia bacterium]